MNYVCIPKTYENIVCNGVTAIIKWWAEPRPLKQSSWKGAP